MASESRLHRRVCLRPELRRHTSNNQVGAVEIGEAVDSRQLTVRQ